MILDPTDIHFMDKNILQNVFYWVPQKIKQLWSNSKFWLFYFELSVLLFMDSKPLGFIPQTQFIRFPILLSIAQSERTYGPKQCEHWGGHIWTGLVLITID